jgi:hypothetical protein
MKRSCGQNEKELWTKCKGAVDKMKRSRGRNEKEL